MSFVSGHSSVAFSTVVTASIVATLRGYRVAPLMWSLGLPMAATVAYLRVAADRHYLTDVVAGAGLGTAIGILLPLLLHRPHGDGSRPLVQTRRTKRPPTTTRSAKTATPTAQWTVAPFRGGITLLMHW